MNNKKLILDQLVKIYGDDGNWVWIRVEKMMAEFTVRNAAASIGALQLNQNDVVLITYADQFLENDQKPLQSLFNFLEDHLNDSITRVHILPFYPYSSDDGFSVIDYRQVNPEYGTWDDVKLIASKYELMFDAVVNHISRKSKWFKDFLLDKAPYKDYFIKVDPDTDLSSVFRPRALPLLTAVETINGEKHVWTTFSEDQIDINYANPQVLIEIIDLLLFYIEHGARLIRLDAIGYIWKEIGTSSLNLDQAHGIVKILRAVLNEVAPYAGLITETNVPHQENIKYFGEPVGNSANSETLSEGDEAQMVYQFSLAPLVLHSFLNADAFVLSKWAGSLSVPYKNAAFFNFIASHDGIGVTPAKGLLNEDEIEALIERTLSHGGKVSYKTNSDGSKSAYELNVTLFDALNNPRNPDPEDDINRFLASQAIMLSLAGVPGIYVHSLFGSRNCHTCVDETLRARSINREKLRLSELEDMLADPGNIHTKVFKGYKHLLHIRRQHPAFHPGGSQTILENNHHVFTVLRSDPANEENVLCLINVSPEEHQLHLNLNQLGMASSASFIDLIDEKVVELVEDELTINLRAYQTMWLTNWQPNTSE